MNQRARLPADINYRPFSRQHALSAGISDSRMRANDLEAPHFGMRRPVGLPSDIFWQARDCQQVMAPGAVFSHLTAIRLYGLPLPLYCDDAIHVSVLAGLRPPERRGIVGHEIDPVRWARTEILHHDHETADRFLIPVVSAPLGWAQLAGVIDRADLVAVGDAILASDPPLATLEDLIEVARLWRGRRGAKALAWAVQLLRYRTWSRPETLFRLMELEAGIPEPQLNVLVFDMSGQELTTPDQSWPQFRVLLEYEGDGHRSQAKFRSDITRYENYADGGWTVVRVHADDVFGDPNTALERLGRRLRSAGWRPLSRELRIVAGARR